MTRTRVEKLRRLAHINELLYLRHASKTAAMAAAHDDMSHRSAQAESWIDGTEPGAAVQRGLVHAARLRHGMAETHRRLDAQRASTVDALAQHKGAVRALDEAIALVQRQSFIDELAEVIERAAHPAMASLEQAVLPSLLSDDRGQCETD